MQVLVAYDSKHGPTAEIARWVSGELRMAGLDAEVRAAGDVDSVDGYDAVVLGNAVDQGRWRREARRFIRRHGDALAGTPLWLFSNGPRKPGADTGTPLPAMPRARQRLSACDHATFGQAPVPDAPGFLRTQIARRAYGDYRNRERICVWAAGIASALTAATKPAGR